MLPSIDEIAQEIRRIDGANTLGAGALAEALHDFLSKREQQTFMGRVLAGKEQLQSPARCWCAKCDLQRNHGLATRMSLCPLCGDKRCQRARDHANACDKA